MPREIYRIGDLTVDVGAASVERDGERVEIPGLSFDLLVALARRAPDVVDADGLVAAVWKQAAVSDETLMQRVTLLRRALGDDANEPRYLRSVRGRGYGLVPDVERVVESAPRPRRKGWIAIAAVAAVVALLLYAWTINDDPVEATLENLNVPPTADEMVRRAGEYRSRHRESDNELAVGLYEQALALEPEHPGALVGLSIALSQRATKFNQSVDEARKGQALAERRLETDPNDARAHYARGLALDACGRIGDALEAYQQAQALDPDNVVPVADAGYLHLVRGELAEGLEASLFAHEREPGLQYMEVQIGWALGMLGYESQAAAWLQRAIDLRPDNVFAGVTLARLRLHQGRLAEAESLALEALDHGVDRAELPLVLGHAGLLRGDHAEAIRRYRQASDISPRSLEARGRMLYFEEPSEQTSERYLELVSELHRIRAEGDEWPGAAIDEMVLHVTFGNLDQALEALDAAIDLGYREPAWLLLDPMLADLRAHPDFVDRIERIGLALERERNEVAAAPWLPEGFLD